MEIRYNIRPVKKTKTPKEMYLGYFNFKTKEEAIKNALEFSKARQFFIFRCEGEAFGENQFLCKNAFHEETINRKDYDK